MLQPLAPLVLSELDLWAFDSFVPEDHYLRKAKKVVDFERFRAISEQAYDAKVMGRPATDVVLMLKILFLRFHYRLSDRQVMVRSQSDVAFRFFLDLPAKEALPNHTTNTYFRKRLGVERFEAIFQELVTQAREHGLVSDRLRLKDATHLLADIADLTALQRLAQMRERLLDAAEYYFAAWVVEQRDQTETLRQSTAELGEIERLAHRVEFLRKLTQALRERVAQLPPSATVPDRPRDRLMDALELAAKLLGDHDDPKAGDRLVNAVDATARAGKHGQFYLGYMLDVAMDPNSEIITAINVLPANGAEAADTITLIRQEESAQGNDVAAVSIDGIGYNGAVLRELSDPKGLNLDVTVPPQQKSASTQFGPERFSLTVLDGQECLECPAGQQTTTRRLDKSGYRYSFKASQCRTCPLRGECLASAASTHGRTVIKNEYDAEYAKVKAKAQTPQYAETRKQHAKIERKLADLTRNHGARRAIFRGLKKTRVQAFMTALVVNVKRMVRLLQKSQEAATSVAGVGAVRAEPI